MFICDAAFRGVLFFFFFNDTATTEIYTLSLHDALPISAQARIGGGAPHRVPYGVAAAAGQRLFSRRMSGYFPSGSDRKSTRLNSSHANISYAVFCLKKKKKHK